MMPVILASRSPRRKQLLQWAEIPFEVMVSDTDESYPAHLEPGDVAIHIALNKALAVQPSAPDRLIVAADTIVVLGAEIIGKPRDRDHAIATLLSLSGRQHRVITGVALLAPGEQVCFADVTEVWFNELSREELEHYVDDYKPYDKAGSYAIQEWIGVVGIRKVSGDFYNVMGLPVSRVVRAIQSMRS